MHAGLHADIEAFMFKAQTQASAALSAALEALSKANADMAPWGQSPLPKIDDGTYNNLMIRAKALDESLYCR